VVAGKDEPAVVMAAREVGRGTFCPRLTAATSPTADVGVPGGESNPSVYRRRISPLERGFSVRSAGGRLLQL